jgi:hypothetical protein
MQINEDALLYYGHKNEMIWKKKRFLLVPFPPNYSMKHGFWKKVQNN